MYNYFLNFKHLHSEKTPAIGEFGEICLSLHSEPFKQKQMSKVLISFIGTGVSASNHEVHKEIREYKTAKYKLDDCIYEKAFMADALVEHFGADKIILIGTAKSMWENIYAVFYQKTYGKSVTDSEEDFARYMEIEQYCRDANHASSLSLPHIKEIEQVLGKGSRVITIKYGLTEEELKENITAILGLEQHLCTGDEIIVDITHAFRSLPMLLMNTLIYLQNVSKKRIAISHIYYGMLECTAELGFTPVVDIKKVMEVNDWISGAYSFMEYGNAYKIADLLEQDGMKDKANVLRQFTDIKNLGHITGLERQAASLRSIHDLSPIAEITVTPVISDFTKKLNLQDTPQRNAQLLYNLAEWLMSKHNYSSAYMLLTECIETFIATRDRIDRSNEEGQKEVKNILRAEHSPMSAAYWKIKKTRNQIAHAKEFERNASSMIRNLQKALTDIKKNIF